MFEQDYIIRLIKEMIRAILKLLFHMDTDNPNKDLLEEKEGRDMLEKLLDMVDNGDINEAENQIYDMTSDNNMVNLEVALLFYSYLNEKEDDFLQKNDFSRDEIKSGLKELISRYGLTGMAEIFLSETSPNCQPP
ncbi:DUF6483 family protein [uncultured Acetatifactor sp.]|uniref:DUF6483 family protein n=1 Tax=uncultured Acetatifactor sp. TaxID=1671927 RepID=UPI0026198315|nr:DUF6483 family protein [uncultured Acetatifactor sp.]